MPNESMTESARAAYAQSLANDKIMPLIPELMADFAEAAVRKREIEIAETLDEKVLHDSDDAVDIVAALEDYIDRLRGETND